MTNTKYVVLAASAILLLVISVPDLWYISARADDSQSSDSSSGDQQGSFSERHPTLCSVGPPGATMLGHPGVGLIIKGICSTG
ncbi:MAG TPA: hypothetical protein VJ729_07165 [Nitrososphaeraceae archaeon]|nr:hypothetical protein [Nitrososphaeraceae archaeon]